MTQPRPETPSETLSGAQIVVRLLERQGVRTLAGIPGGAILPIYDALSQSTQLHHVLARHEQGAGFMAQGMARATGGNPERAKGGSRRDPRTSLGCAPWTSTKPCTPPVRCAG